MDHFLGLISISDNAIMIFAQCELKEYLRDSCAKKVGESENYFKWVWQVHIWFVKTCASFIVNPKKIRAFEGP